MKFVEDDSLYERPKQARGEAFVDAVFTDASSEVIGDEAAPDKASEATLQSDGNATSNSITEAVPESIDA
ncbi:MAG: hypothetical protein IAF08_11870, partial [Rhizobacter sp.]|nr:hypothetical protein [Chlorobiales bacterium]